MNPYASYRKNGWIQSKREIFERNVLRWDRNMKRGSRMTGMQRRRHDKSPRGLPYRYWPCAQAWRQYRRRYGGAA